MKKIILYSNGCPKCMVLKHKMQAKNIPFIENNNLEELAKLGFQSLPVLKVEDYKDFSQANTWVNEWEGE